MNVNQSNTRRQNNMLRIEDMVQRMGDKLGSSDQRRQVLDNLNGRTDNELATMVCRLRKPLGLEDHPLYTTAW